MNIDEILAGLVCVLVPILIIGLIVGVVKKSKKKVKNGVSKGKPKTLEEIFNMSFSEFNPAEYKKGKTITEAGSELQNYFKLYNEKLAGVFTSLNIKDFKNSTGVNFVFTNNESKSIPIKNFVKLVNEVSNLYGTDENGKKFISPDELKEFSQNEFYWTGRSWQNHEFLPTLSIYADDEYGYSLTIWTK